MNVQEVLGELWFRRKGFLEKKDTASADRQVGLMRDVVRREGILSAEDLSGAFLVDGARVLETGSPRPALQSFHLAKEFAPDRPDASFAVAWTLWKGERDLWGALAAATEGIRIALKNPSARTAQLGNLSLIAAAGSLLAAVLWCIISAFRTARLAQHDLYEARSRSLSESPAHLAAWALWLLPALVWMTGWWILVYWLGLGLAYMKRSERAVSIAACVCFVSALPLLGWITRQSAVTTDPAVRFLLEASRGSSDSERIPALEQMAAAHPKEPIYRFLLAQAYGASGSPEAALQEYRRVQEADPRSANAWINSGNLFFAQDQYAQAAEEYRRALQANPRSALAYFNLHLALQAALRLEEADEAFRQARVIDNALVTSILATAGAEDRKSPVEARYSGEEILDRVQREPGRGRPGSLTKEWLDPLPVAGGIGLLACLFFPWTEPRRGLGSARKCGKCGQPFCRKCQVGVRRDDGHCTGCRHLYLLKDPVAPRVREERERLVAAHERWQWISRRLVSLVLPGAGQIQGGRTFLGVLLLWVTCVSLAAILLSGDLLAYPRLAGVLHAAPWVRFPAIIGIAVSWLAGNVIAFNKEA